MAGYRIIERNGVRVKEFDHRMFAGPPALSVAEIELLNGVYPPEPHKEACNNECDVIIYVVRGCVHLIRSDYVTFLEAGNATYIPKGTWYRMEVRFKSTPILKLVHTASPPYSIDQHAFR